MKWFFLVITIVLLLIWPLRWDIQLSQGATYKIDHWTGQSWVLVHDDVNNGQKEIPVLSEKEIENNRNLPEFENRIKKEIEVQKRLIQNNLEGHEKYLQLKEKIEAEIWTSMKPPNYNPGWHKDKNGKEVFTLPGEYWTPENQKIVDVKTEARIPNEIIKQHEAFIKASNDLDKLKKSLDMLPQQAEILARSKSYDNAYSKKQIATNIWLFTTIISLISTGLSFIISHRKKNSEKKIRE